MMNKKGQGLSWSTLIGGLIGIVILILVVMALMGFFNPLDDLFSKVSTPELAIQSCNGYSISEKFIYSYCDNFQEVKFSGSSNNEYVNCADPRISKNLGSTLDCGEGRVETFCANLRKGKNFKGAVVNGIDCPVLTAEEKELLVKIDGIGDKLTLEKKNEFRGKIYDPSISFNTLKEFYANDQEFMELYS